MTNKGGRTQSHSTGADAPKGTKMNVKGKTKTAAECNADAATALKALKHAAKGTDDAALTNAAIEFADSIRAARAALKREMSDPLAALLGGKSK